MSDGGLCAHFEETVAVTSGEPEVLTALARPGGPAGAGAAG